MPNISSIVKNVRNIMRNEDQGISGDAQRLEQLGWMLFLKILDEKDQELELIREEIDPDRTTSDVLRMLSNSVTGPSI